MTLSKSWQACLDLQWLQHCPWCTRSTSYHGNCRENINVIQTTPCFWIAVRYAGDWVQDSVVDDDTIQSLPGRVGKIASLLTQAKVASITCQDLDLAGILAAQLLQWLFATRSDDQIGLLLQQVVCNGETDTCRRSVRGFERKLPPTDLSTRP